MTLIRSIPDVERLRVLLAETPPDPQLVCAKAGVILEAALDFLTQLYECSVPRRPGGLYTLGDLLPSVDKKLDSISAFQKQRSSQSLPHRLIATMKSAPITKIIIKRFRSFPTATLAFDNPLFVVGRNGSGKSNLADLFSFVSEAMSSPLQAVFDRRGGIGAVRNRSSGQQSYPPNLGLAFEFGPVNGLEGGRFAFEVKALPNYGYRIVREQCRVRKKGGARWWFDRKDTWNSNVKGLTPALEPSALAMPLVGGDERFAPIFRVMGAMRVYSIQPAKLREMQDPDSGVALKSDGSNAASVLQELLRGEGASATKTEINRILELIVPATNAVSPKKHGNKLSLSFSQEWER